LILLAGLGLFLFGAARGDVELSALDEVKAQLGEVATHHLSYWRILLWLGLGMVLLPLGAEFVVDSGTSLAESWGIGEAVIGLTIVALGTSLPELATTVAAAFRRNVDVALGNVIGSNIFNMLAIVGITALIADLDVAPAFLSYDVWVMLVVALFLTAAVWRRQVIGLRLGILLLIGYGLYIYHLVTGSLS